MPYLYLGLSLAHAWGRGHQGEDHQEDEVPCDGRLQSERRASTGAKAAGAPSGVASLLLFFGATFAWCGVLFFGDTVDIYIPFLVVGKQDAGTDSIHFVAPQYRSHPKPYHPSQLPSNRKLAFLGLLSKTVGGWESKSLTFL